VTDDLACIGLWGPDARDVLGQATGDDLSNGAFPYLTARKLTVAGKPAWVQRVSYIGELGWELYLANDDAGAVLRPTARDVRLGTLPADANLTTGSVRRTHHAR